MKFDTMAKLAINILIKIWIIYSYYKETVLPDTSSEMIQIKELQPYLETGTSFFIWV